MNNVTGISLDRILMDGISDMVFVVSVENESEFIYTFLNRAAMDGTGMTKSVLGKPIRESHPHETADLIYKHYQKVVNSHETVSYEDSFIAPSGIEHYSETKLIPLFNDRNECKQIVATVKNISKEKWAEEESIKAWARLSESKKRYQSLFQHNSDAIISFDLQGRITNGNDTVKNVTGYKPIELMGSTLNSLMVKEDSNLVTNLFMQAVGGITDNTITAIQNKKGNRVEISLKVTPLIIDDEVIGIYGILRDITEIIHSQKKLEESEKRFRIIAENAHDLITLLSDQGEIIYVSPSYKNILGYHHMEFIGKSFLHNIHSDDTAHLNEKILQSIKNEEPFNMEFKQYNSDGEVRWFEAYGTPVFDDKRRFQHMVVLTRDINLKKQYESKLEYFALHDPLTGLPNRLLFNKQFEQARENFQKNKDGLAVIMLDIDHFKSINDELGHDIGDSVIKEFGNRVRRVIRDIDTVARLGGDEFVIVLPSIQSKDNAVIIAEKILKVMQEPWDMNDNIPTITTSIGIAVAASIDITKYLMMKNADLALYEAKNSGRNSYKL